MTAPNTPADDARLGPPEQVAAAERLMRNAAAIGGWPPEVPRPTGDPAALGVLTAALVLGGEALARLEGLGQREREADPVSTDLVGLAIAQALHRRDEAAIRALVPADLAGCASALVACASILARVVEEASDGKADMAYASLRREVLAENVGEDPAP